MLKRDDELRLSQETQVRYALFKEDWSWKWEVTESVQRQVCEETGFAENVDFGLDLMRSALKLFPGDQEVKDAAHYLRYNSHEACPLVIGAKVPEMEVFDLEGERRALSSVAQEGAPTLVLAGSHT